MIKRVLTIVLTCLLLFSLCGCWDAKELNTLSIVTGIGIDICEEDEEMFNFLAQTGKAEPSSKSGGGSDSGKSPYILYKLPSVSIDGAIEELSAKSSRKPYLHHNQVIIIGRAQAEKGINRFIDAFVRGKEMRLIVPIVISDTTAEEVLVSKTQPEPIPSLYISTLLQTVDAVAKHDLTSILYYLNERIEKGVCPVIPIIKTGKSVDGKTDELQLSGLAMVKDGKLVGELLGDELKAYAWMINDFADFYIQTKTDKNYISAMLTKQKVSLKADVSGDDIKLDFHLTGEAALTEQQSHNDEEIDKLRPYYEELINTHIENILTDAFAKTQSASADIFKISMLLHRTKKKFWHKIKDEWDEVYPTIKLNVDINIKLEQTGKISGPYTDKENKE